MWSTQVVLGRPLERLAGGAQVDDLEPPSLITSLLTPSCLWPIHFLWHKIIHCEGMSPRPQRLRVPDWLTFNVSELPIYMTPTPSSTTLTRAMITWGPLWRHLSDAVEQNNIHLICWTVGLVQNGPVEQKQSILVKFYQQYHSRQSHLPSAPCFGLASTAFVVSYWLSVQFRRPMRHEHEWHRPLARHRGRWPHSDCWLWPWPRDVIPSLCTALMVCGCLLADLQYQHDPYSVFQLHRQLWQYRCWAFCSLPNSVFTTKNTTA